MQVCISLQTDNHASTPPLSFLQAGCPSCRPTNSVNALEAESTECYTLQHESKTFIHLKLLKNFLQRLKILGHSWNFARFYRMFIRRQNHNVLLCYPQLRQSRAVLSVTVKWISTFQRKNSREKSRYLCCGVTGLYEIWHTLNDEEWVSQVRRPLKI